MEKFSPVFEYDSLINLVKGLTVPVKPLICLPLLSIVLLPYLAEYLYLKLSRKRCSESEKHMRCNKNCSFCEGSNKLNDLWYRYADIKSRFSNVYVKDIKLMNGRKLQCVNSISSLKPSASDFK